MSSPDLGAAARVAEAAADAARHETGRRFRRVAVETKSDGSPVTEADRAAERSIRRVLRAFDPELPILGEEYGAEGDAGQHGWLVDPIDGTVSYSRGIPLYSTLIALLWEGDPVLGLIDLPALDERTVGYRGGGVRCNGRLLRVSRETELERAIVAHGDAYAFDFFGARKAYDDLAARLKMFRGYTDAFGHALVLGGGVDAMLDVGLNPWDAAATQALIPEAGGRCITIDRRKAGRGLGLVFGSPALVEPLAAALEEAG